jgi:predicted GNAT superfamily acetyltransferase
MTAGAFLGGKLVGFIHGLARTNLGKPCHHSHLLAVRPKFAGNYRIKFKAEALPLRDQVGGYRLLYSHNAQFPLSQAPEGDRESMGTLARVFPALEALETPDTNRVELVNWDLDRPEVERAARGIAPEPAMPRISRGRARAICPPRGGSRWRYRREAPRSMRPTRPRPAAREPLRRTARALFDRGYEAVGLVARRETALYVFER